MNDIKTSKRIHGNLRKVIKGVSATRYISLRATVDEKEWFRQKSKYHNYKTLSDFIRCLLEENKINPIEQRQFPGNKDKIIRVRCNDNEMKEFCKIARIRGYDELSEYLRGLLAAA